MPAPCSNSGSFPRLTTGGRRFALRGRQRENGFTLLEVVAAMIVAVVLGVIVTGGFLMSQKMAASGRIRTQARVILQRNIDLALSIPFTGVSTPPSLELTVGQSLPGVPFNDPTLPPPSQVGQVPLLVSSNDGAPLVTGTLWRHCEELDNPDKAVIHRITFTVRYDYLGSAQEISLTTLRSRDDQ